MANILKDLRLRMSELEKERLMEMSDDSKCSQAELVRRLINGEYQRRREGGEVAIRFQPAPITYQMVEHRLPPEPPIPPCSAGPQTLRGLRAAED